MTDLPSALGDLSSALAWAEPVDLVVAVRARVDGPAAPKGPTPDRHRRRRGDRGGGPRADAGGAPRRPSWSASATSR